MVVTAMAVMTIMMVVMIMMIRKITPEAMANLTKQVKKQLNFDYSDNAADEELEGRIAACAESLILGGMTADMFEAEKIPATIIETIRIMIIDLSEETPGLTVLSPAANYFALQIQLGVDGNG